MEWQVEAVVLQGHHKAQEHKSHNRQGQGSDTQWAVWDHSHCHLQPENQHWQGQGLKGHRATQDSSMSCRCLDHWTQKGLSRSHQVQWKGQLQRLY